MITCNQARQLGRRLIDDSERYTAERTPGVSSGQENQDGVICPAGNRPHYSPPEIVHDSLKTDGIAIGNHWLSSYIHMGTKQITGIHIFVRRMHMQLSSLPKQRASPGLKLHLAWGCIREYKETLTKALRGLVNRP